MNWFVGAALILLLSLILNLGLLAYAMYTLLGVIVGGRLLTRHWADSLSAERECNRLTANVGDRVAVMLTVSNKSRLPISWVLLEDLLPAHALMFDPPSLQVEGERTMLAMLPPGGSRHLRYQMACNRRGYYQLGPLVLETGDLFGLHRRCQVVTKPHFLLVYPKVVPLEGYEITSKRPIGEVRMTYRLYEDPTRIAGVRQYQAGDPLNRVHWRATASTGVLHSKVYEPSTVAGATIVLDFHRNSHPRRNEPMRSELAVTAAASLANALYEMGQQVGLVTNGRDAADRIRTEGWQIRQRNRAAAREAAAMHSSSDRLRPVLCPTQRGPEQVMRILEMLARLELTDGLELPELLGETTSRIPRDASVVVIVQTVSENQAVALGNLKRQGYAVTAIVNTHDETDFAESAGPLLAQGLTVQQLRDEASIVSVCRRFILG